MVRFAATIFLGAFLLFLVQPLIGKFILPWFGGGPGVWTTCIMLFQVLLLVGYAYAHFISRMLTPKWQFVVHAVLLAGAALTLPIIPDPAWKPLSADHPTGRILLLVLICVGGPFVMLSATGPLLQAWFSRAYPQRSPYRLYALSNLGSLLALLSYPFVVEPNWTRRAQAIGWSWAFGAFAVLCAYCAFRARQNPAWVGERDVDAAKASGQKSKISVQPTSQRDDSWVDRVLWLLLPACASIMLLAVTAHISEEIAPVPFLWVLPLGVYLMSFIVAFEWPRAYVRPVFGFAALACAWLVMIMMQQPYLAITVQLAGSMFILFVCCMVCHGELYRLRPAAHRLTWYYLVIAAGGAVGGAFVTLAAPVLFTTHLEFYIGLFGAMALLLACLFNDSHSMFHHGARRAGWLALVALALAGGFGLRLAASHQDEDVVLRSRDFYGILSINLRNREKSEGQYLTLEHGRITHGAQILHAILKHWPTMYYGPKTGVGIVMEGFPKANGRRIGAVGLGIGTLATYGKPGDTFRFYEINPQVERLAREQFSYLADSAAQVEVILGDARLSLEREEPQHFDILVLDAFSGDAIPIHLLTKEAFAIYQRHLNPDGVIAVHVSNRYLDLHPVMHRVGAEFGFTVIFVNTPPDQPNLIQESHWVLLTHNEQVLNLPAIKETGFRPEGLPHVRLWTDDDASLFEILR